MPKKVGKGKGKKVKVEEEQPVIVKKEEPKVKYIPPPRFDAVKSKEMHENMKKALETFFEEKKNQDDGHDGGDDENNEENESETIHKEKFSQFNPNPELTSDFKQFKNTFFPKFETALKQIETIRDDDEKNGAVQKLYYWYIETVESFKKLHPIEITTHKPEYDHSPDISQRLTNKSKVWEAQMFPREFEASNRTQDDLSYLPPRERLKQYQTRKVNEDALGENMLTNNNQNNLTNNNLNNLNNKDKDNNLGNIAKIDPEFQKYTEQRQTASASTNFRSTKFTNFNGTGNKFFNPGGTVGSNLNSNVFGSNQVIKEVKSNYITFCPKYNFENLYIEKMNYNYKQREIADKKYEIEKKKMLVEFGFARAGMKSELDRKQNLRQIVTCRSINEQTFTKMNEDMMKKGLEDKPINFKINLNHIKNIKAKDENDPINIKSSIKSMDSQIANNNTIEKKEKIINIDSIIKDKNTDNLLNNLQEKLGKDFEGEKVPEIPSEAISTARIVNPLFDARQSYYKTLNLKPIDKMKPEYSIKHNPLSVFDITNLDNVNINPHFKQPPKQVCLHRPSTSLDFKSLDPNNNPLNRRRLLSGSKNFEIDRIKTSLLNKNIHVEDLKSKILPPENKKTYSMNFLPFPGISLMAKVERKKDKK